MHRRPPPRPVPRNGPWVWIAMCVILAAMVGLGYWAFFIPWYGTPKP